jgi:ankyrin repeat protein
LNSITKLIKKGAKVNYRIDYGDGTSDTTLNSAMRVANLNIITKLIEAGADVNCTDANQNTPFHATVDKNNSSEIEIIALLLKYGANINARNKEGLTPLHLAARRIFTAETVQALLAAGADPELRDRYNKTPFDYAKAEPSNVEAALILRNTLKSAAKKPNATVAVSTKLRDQYLAQIEKMYPSAKYPPVRPQPSANSQQLGRQLFNAVESKNTALAVDLIKQGADLNYKGEFYTVLIQAITSQNLLLTKILLEAGADPNFRNPLYYTISAPRMVALLIKQKADVNAVYSERDLRILHAATIYGEDENTIALLLEAGADKTAVDFDNQTPLAYAENKGKVKMALLLGGTVESTNRAYAAAEEKWKAELRGRERDAYAASFEGRRELAIERYDKVHEGLEFYLGSHNSAVEKYNRGGAGQFLMKGTLNRIYESKRLAALSIESLLDEHGKYLPKELFEHIFGDYKSLGGLKSYSF